MVNDYVQHLETWIKTKGLKKQDANVAAFLAVRELVKARLDDGYSATVIFDFLRDTKQIDVCYDTFLKYVHRHVRPPRRRRKAGTVVSKKQSGKVAEPTDNKTQAVETPGPLKGFVYNPVPNPDELL